MARTGGNGSMTESRFSRGRREVLFGLLGAAALAGGARAGEVPRREPYLTDAWLERLAERYGPAEPAPERARRVLFVGNSITLNHDVPARVRALAEAAGIRIETAMAAASGARLRESARIGMLERLLRDGEWDVLVLQDYTTTPFRGADREASEETMARLAEIARPKRVVLYPPWPRAARHRFYGEARDGFDVTPHDPAEFAGATMEFYGRVAEAHGFSVAPVPEAWMAAVAEGRALYDADDYHASEEGAELAARVLWERLQLVLAEVG